MRRELIAGLVRWRRHSIVYLLAYTAVTMAFATDVLSLTVLSFGIVVSIVCIVGTHRGIARLRRLHTRRGKSPATMASVLAVAEDTLRFKRRWTIASVPLLLIGGYVIGGVQASDADVLTLLSKPRFLLYSAATIAVMAPLATWLSVRFDERDTRATLRQLRELVEEARQPREQER